MSKVLIGIGAITAVVAGYVALDKVVRHFQRKSFCEQYAEVENIPYAQAQEEISDLMDGDGRFYNARRTHRFSLNQAEIEARYDREMAEIDAREAAKDAA